MEPTEAWVEAADEDHEPYKLMLINHRFALEVLEMTLETMVAQGSTRFRPFPVQPGPQVSPGHQSGSSNHLMFSPHTHQVVYNGVSLGNVTRVGTYATTTNKVVISK